MSSSVSSSSRTQKHIRDHYDDLVSGRIKHNGHLSEKVSAFSNWVKCVVSRDNVNKSGSRILDLCSGKGGDLHKWKHLCPSVVVFMDFSCKSVDHCRQRLQSANTPYRWFCIVEDACLPRAKSLLSVHAPFDLVSCQFALQYAFETKERATQIMRNIAESLWHRGGRFVCIVPDGEYIMNLQWAYGNEFGNSMYRIRFLQNERRNILARDFGEAYMFDLNGAIVDCPEFLVLPHVFHKLAASVGLRVVKDQNFADFYYDNKRRQDGPAQMLRRFGVDVPGMTSDEWQVMKLYRVYECSRD